jgi:molybdopterin/thiamine biosynthesis adenylyltransferase/rhodanese-related sulfurtransferase
VNPTEVDLGAIASIIDIRPIGSRPLVLDGSVAVASSELLADPGSFIPAPHARVLVVCDLGVRSASVASALSDAGYANVQSLEGGIEGWRSAGRSVTTTTHLPAAVVDRFDRHIKLAEIGVTGHERLMGSRIAVVGAGGLGSPVLTYLAAAGVGALRIVEPDKVETSNLHRQPMYGPTDVGVKKADAANHYLRRVNPDVEIDTFEVELDEDNAVNLLDGCRVVVDATDRFEARYAIADAAHHLGIPVVFGAVYRWEGRLAVFPPDGPCYRCLFPAPPSDSRALECAITGVLGSVAGTVGAMQATEAIKIAAGIGTELEGRLTIYDGWTQRSDTVTIGRRPDCPTGHS